MVQSVKCNHYNQTSPSYYSFKSRENDWKSNNITLKYQIDKIGGVK